MGDSSSSTTEVGSTDEIVRALLDWLVDPLLPLKPRGTPSLSQHESVAKQMHATVLLYNYYHIKCHPELQFLEFESFCKLAVTLKPSLSLYMKSTHQIDLAKPDDHENQLSLTEKAIMDACSISRTLLDASEDISRSIKEWPIIKVAVLLVDSTKENCLLLFSSVTNGVWSVIEKDLDSESLVVGSKRKRSKISKPSVKEHDADDEAGFQNAAFLAVKESAGINRAELKVLESSVAYTLSNEKTAARFYIVQSTQAISEDSQAIKDAIDSLQGPLVSKSSGSWMVTPAVEYFHLLPYAGIIADWFSREVLLNSLDDRSGTETVDVISCSPKKICKRKLGSEAKGVTSNTSSNVNVGLDSVKNNSLSIDKQCDSKVTETKYCSDKSCIILDGGKKALAVNEATENPGDKKVMEPGHCGDKQESVAIESPGQKNCNESHMVDSSDSTSGSQSMDIDKNPVVCLPKEKITSSIPGAVKVYKYQKKRGTSSPSAEYKKIDSTNGIKIQSEQVTNLKMETADLKTESLLSEFRTEKAELVTNLRTETADLKTESCLSDFRNEKAEPVTDLRAETADLKTESCLSDFRNEKAEPVTDLSAETADLKTESCLSDFRNEKAEPVTNLRAETADLKTESCLSDFRNEKAEPVTNLRAETADLKTESCLSDFRNEKAEPVTNLRAEKADLKTESCLSDFRNEKAEPVTNLRAETADLKTESCLSDFRNEKAEPVTNLSAEKADLKTESCLSELSNEKVDTENLSCVVSRNLDGAQTVDRSLVPFELKTSYEEKVQVAFASKERALTQTALRVLVRKREKLSNELRNLEDEMAVCERNIQAILDGAENNLAIKLEAILDCCNETCFQSKVQAQYLMNQDADNKGLQRHSPKGKRLSEAILSVRTPCQELKNICCANNWMLPMFRVTPCDGGFLADASVKGLDFECSCGSELHPTLDGARNMAAERIIAKLQNMAGQVQ